MLRCTKELFLEGDVKLLGTKNMGNALARLRMSRVGAAERTGWDIDCQMFSLEIGIHCSLI